MWRSRSTAIRAISGGSTVAQSNRSADRFLGVLRPLSPRSSSSPRQLLARGHTARASRSVDARFSARGPTRAWGCRQRQTGNAPRTRRAETGTWGSVRFGNRTVMYREPKVRLQASPRSARGDAPGARRTADVENADCQRETTSEGSRDSPRTTAPRRTVAVDRSSAPSPFGSPRQPLRCLA
jgi:hypothetical protein